MWKQSSKFNAVGTSGEEYVIVEWTSGSEGGEQNQAEIEGTDRRKHTLEDGRELSARKDGTFILLENDDVLKAASPSAPAGE